MISKTHLSPEQLIERLRHASEQMHKKMHYKKEGDVHIDEEVLKLIFHASNMMKQLAYSYLFMLDNDGKLNAANIEVLKKIEGMDDSIRKHSREGIEEENYLRKLAAHFEALAEGKLKEAAKMAKHIEIAKQYEELAKEHERIAQAMEKQ